MNAGRGRPESDESITRPKTPRNKLIPSGFCCEERIRTASA